VQDDTTEYTTMTQTEIKGGFIKDGPRCGYRNCGGSDWFVGENEWRCTKCGKKR